jgi:hypothetical protein
MRGGGIHLDQHNWPCTVLDLRPDTSRGASANRPRGSPASSPRASGGEGKVTVDFQSVPRGVSTRAEASGIFKNVEMTNSKQMPTSAGGPPEALPDGGPF